MRPVSKKRASQADARRQCREIVLARDRLCRGHGLTSVRCAMVPSEVHELGRGAYRSSCFLNPDLCIAVCRACHQWITEHPIQAQDAGLALAGWQVEQRLKEAGQ